MTESSISRLQRWYLAQCNGDWEHSWGLKVDTLDNPGWTLKVDLTETALAGRASGWTKVERSGADWIFYRSTGAVFEAACGPSNLEEAIEAFLAFSAEADGE